MKSNKTLIAILAVGGLLALSPALIAADTNTPPAGATPPAGGPPGMRQGGRMMGPNADQLAKDLDLNDDTKAKVTTILADQRKKMTDLRADTTLSQEDRRAKMQTIREETTSKMKDVLTPEQFDKFQKMAPAQRPRRNAPPGGDTNAPAAKPPQA